MLNGWTTKTAEEQSRIIALVWREIESVLSGTDEEPRQSPWRFTAMDRVTLHDHLAQTERHITQGQQTIARQRTLIVNLQDEGLDTQAAEDLLKQFEATQAMHIADRDRLLRELGIAVP